MRFAFSVLAILALCVGLSRGDVIKQYDFGHFGSGGISPLDSVTITLGLGNDDADPAAGSGHLELFNIVLPKTDSGSYSFTANSSTPGWSAFIARLIDGTNRYISPIVIFGDSGVSVSNGATTLFNDHQDAFIFPSPASLTAQPITSIKLDITNLAFTTVPDPDFGAMYNADMDIALTFNSASTAPAAPLPSALPASLLLLLPLALRTLRRGQATL